VEREKERNFFNGTSHFCFLPQGERKEKRKDFNRPFTIALSHDGEREEKEKRENFVLYWKRCVL